MWLGLLLREPDDGDQDLVTLCAWAPEPSVAIRVTGPPGGMAQCARLLRATLGFGAVFALPRCPHCRAPVELPALDAPVAEAA